MGTQKHFFGLTILPVYILGIFSGVILSVATYYLNIDEEQKAESDSWLWLPECQLSTLDIKEVDDGAVLGNRFYYSILDKTFFHDHVYENGECPQEFFHVTEVVKAGDPKWSHLIRELATCGTTGD